MTRAAGLNIVCAFTTPAKLPDPQPGTRPAPELARHERLAAERAGLPVPEVSQEGEPRPRERLAVLADILASDGAELSALEVQRRNLANADHLARLDAMWRDIVGRVEKDRYRQAFRELLPADARRRAGGQLPGAVAVAHPARRRGRGPGRAGSRRPGRAGPAAGRRPGHRGRHRRPDPAGDRKPAARAVAAVGRASARRRRPATAGLPARAGRRDGRPPAADRRARRGNLARLGGGGARPGAGRPGGTAGVGEPRRPHRRLPRAVRLGTPGRALRPRASR